MAETITVFSDYVCPFCYLGRRSLAEYQASREEELEIDWHPFDLRSNQRNEEGEVVRESGHDDDYYEQARENVERLREEYGADEMATTFAGDDVDSLDAQVASYHVKAAYDYETWLDFDEALFEALWEDERDIGDVDVLAAIADEVGIDADEVRDAVSDETLREEVTASFSEAHEMGITGVPTFAYEGYAARGAVPPEQLRRLVEGQ
ncbi:2-hydroxychromene-2-carboxylate isomerase/DsbA-like thioredoxin domain [Halarchaeum acidiphilum MH1-52-1]|uniref:2-hydroxychromene-2-carboxylate isomerase/DsbA-like thioredoxin domain n=1 Tax=Halarchaeum acidiphilum MH1-52-1 TaxID=1261545 RepID=U3A2N3_9EURY|nr:DsbA family protein [Halarchaeum acidiphilum]GAD51899.1 2-hydroxychromene-2-carboxylate isomerase/DsbA-like thioredoxin domain [Halarchaeum acidiphilum MH1-52-1]